MMSATATTTVNGLRLLEAVDFNRHLCAAIICTRTDSEQKELLDSIPGPSRRNVAYAVWMIREALGLEAAYALDICQGRE